MILNIYLIRQHYVDWPGPLKNVQLHSNVIVGLLLASCPQQPQTQAAPNLSTPPVAQRENNTRVTGAHVGV